MGSVDETFTAAGDTIDAANNELQQSDATVSPEEAAQPVAVEEECTKTPCCGQGKANCTEKDEA